MAKTGAPAESTDPQDQHPHQPAPAESNPHLRKAAGAAVADKADVVDSTNSTTHELLMNASGKEIIPPKGSVNASARRMEDDSNASAAARIRPAVMEIDGKPVQGKSYSREGRDYFTATEGDAKGRYEVTRNADGSTSLDPIKRGQRRGQGDGDDDDGGRNRNRNDEARARDNLAPKAEVGEKPADARIADPRTTEPSRPADSPRLAEPKAADPKPGDLKPGDKAVIAKPETKLPDAPSASPREPVVAKLEPVVAKPEQVVAKPEPVTQRLEPAPPAAQPAVPRGVEQIATTVKGELPVVKEGGPRPEPAKGEQKTEGASPQPLAPGTRIDLPKTEQPRIEPRIDQPRIEQPAANNQSVPVIKGDPIAPSIKPEQPGALRTELPKLDASLPKQGEQPVVRGEISGGVKPDQGMLKADLSGGKLDQANKFDPTAMPKPDLQNLRTDQQAALAAQLAALNKPGINPGDGTSSAKDGQPVGQLSGRAAEMAAQLAALVKPGDPAALPGKALDQTGQPIKPVDGSVKTGDVVGVAGTRLGDLAVAGKLGEIQTKIGEQSAVAKLGEDLKGIDRASLTSQVPNAARIGVDGMPLRDTRGSVTDHVLPAQANQTALSEMAKALGLAADHKATDGKVLNPLDVKTAEAALRLGDPLRVLPEGGKLAAPEAGVKGDLRQDIKHLDVVRPDMLPVNKPLNPEGLMPGLKENVRPEALAGAKGELTVKQEPNRVESQQHKVEGVSLAPNLPGSRAEAERGTRIDQTQIIAANEKPETGNIIKTDREPEKVYTDTTSSAAKFDELIDKAKKQRDQDRLDEEEQMLNQRNAMMMAILAQKKQQQEQEEKEFQLRHEDAKKKGEDKRRRYVVKEKETLESIAKKQLRDVRLAALLYEINKHMLPIRMEKGKQVVDPRPGTAIWLPAESEIKEFRGRLYATPKPGAVTSGGKFATADEELASKFGADWDGSKTGVTVEAGMMGSAVAKSQSRRENIEKILGPMAGGKAGDGARIRYIVRLTDSIESVAAKHPALKDAELWPLLANLNGLSTDVDASDRPLAELRRGMVLDIPLPAEIEQFRNGEYDDSEDSEIEAVAAAPDVTSSTTAPVIPSVAERKNDPLQNVKVDLEEDDPNDEDEEEDFDDEEGFDEEEELVGQQVEQPKVGSGHDKIDWEATVEIPAASMPSTLPAAPVTKPLPTPFVVPAQAAQPIPPLNSAVRSSLTPISSSSVESQAVVEPKSGLAAQQANTPAPRPQMPQQAPLTAPQVVQQTTPKSVQTPQQPAPLSPMTPDLVLSPAHTSAISSSPYELAQASGQQAKMSASETAHNLPAAPLSTGTPGLPSTASGVKPAFPFSPGNSQSSGNPASAPASGPLPGQLPNQLPNQISNQGLNQSSSTSQPMQARPNPTPPAVPPITFNSVLPASTHQRIAAQAPLQSQQSQTHSQPMQVYNPNNVSNSEAATSSSTATSPTLNAVPSQKQAITNAQPLNVLDQPPIDAGDRFIWQLDPSVRLVKSSIKWDPAIGVFRSQLELLLQDVWYPVIFYEVYPNMAVRHEYIGGGRKKSVKMDLPPIPAQELADNDLVNNWQRYCHTFVGQFNNPTGQAQ